MTLRDKCQGNQHAGEAAHFTGSAELHDLAKGRTHKVREGKKIHGRKEQGATEQLIPPFSLHWTTTASISSEQMLSEPII